MTIIDNEIKHGMVQTAMLEHYKKIFESKIKTEVKLIGNIIPIWECQNKKVVVLKNERDNCQFILD